jgi:hypothetical protein
MNKGMSVEVKLTLSKCLPPAISEVKFGRYKIQIIQPSSATEVGAILSFFDTYKDPRDGSNPEEEANIICNILSLFSDVCIKKEGLKINKIDIPISKNQELKRLNYPQFFGVLDPTQIEDYIKRVLSLSENLAKQFIRSCCTYSLALDFIPSDPAFAFFLLVVSVECLSNQEEIISFSEIDTNSKFKRFRQFIIKYFPEKYKGKVERDDELFKELLKTVYHSLRSGFVHGGKEVSYAALMADRTHSSYFKHFIEGKETKTPGLGWFTTVVREAILGYLNSIPTPSEDSIDEQLISRLACEKAFLNIKYKRKTEKGSPVILNNIDYK